MKITTTVALSAFAVLALAIGIPLLTACAKDPPPPTNHAITFVRMIEPTAKCDSIRAGMGAFPDVAQCRAGNAVFHCEAGPETPGNCKKVADLSPPPAERPPAPAAPVPSPAPSGSPVLPGGGK